MNIQKYFSESEKKQITDAIKEAELNTSGEIRLHVEAKSKGEPLDSAAFWFGKLAMHKTEARNGVLFYMAVQDKKFAIIGDIGINAKVEDNFWDSIKAEMQANFKEGEITKGLVTGIKQAGNKLKEHFPYQSDDVNELSDDISFGNN